MSLREKALSNTSRATMLGLLLAARAALDAAISLASEPQDTILASENDGEPRTEGPRVCTHPNGAKVESFGEGEQVVCGDCGYSGPV